MSMKKIKEAKGRNSHLTNYRDLFKSHAVKHLRKSINKSLHTVTKQTTSTKEAHSRKPLRINRLLPTLLSLVAITALASCVDGGGAGIANGPTNDGALLSNNTHISTADSRLTVSAIENGINPSTTLLDDKFYCHLWSDPAFNVPDEIITVSGNSYTTTQGSGNVEQLVGNEDYNIAFRNGPFDGQLTDLVFTDNGQSFSVKVMGDSAHCYQRGSASEYALARFTRAEFDPGTYNCRNINNGKDVALIMSENGTYKLGNTQGQWSANGGIRSTNSTVNFTNGALGGATLDFQEMNNNGFRWFERVKVSADGLFDNGQSVGPSTLRCSAFGTPTTNPVYGSQAAPAARGSTFPLEGRYVRSIDVDTSSDVYHKAEHLWFDSNGYVYRGKTPSIGIDCNRTKPNGLPFCETYDFDGEKITFYSEMGARIATYYAQADGTTLTKLRGYKTVPASIATLSSITGLWTNIKWWNDGCMVIGFYCNNGFSELAYAFNGDARFLYSSDGVSTLVGNAAGVLQFGTSAVFQSSDLSKSGNVSNDGTDWTFSYDNGDLTRRYIVQMGKYQFAINDKVYTFKSQ